MDKFKTVYNSDIAETYNQDRQDEEHWKKENEFIQKYFNGKHIENLLDIPIGTGRFLEYYPKHTNITGMDISFPMIEQAKKEALRLKIEKIVFELGNAENLKNIKDRSIDTIVCCRLLHLVKNKERIRILKEFSRVLKGELVLQVYVDKPQKYPLLKGALKITRKLFPKKNNNNKPWSHIQSYELSEKSLQKILKKAKLVIVERLSLCLYNGLNVDMIVLRNADL